MTAPRRFAPPRLPRAVAMGVLVAVASYTVALLVVPSVRHRLVIEDGIIETTTAFVFLGAAIVATIAMFLTQARRLYWLVPVFGLLGFLDEMRFGARIIEFDLPMVDGTEIDSFHDVLSIAVGPIRDLTGTTVLLAALGFLAGVGAIALHRTGRLHRGFSWLADHVPITLLLAAIGFLAAGAALDQVGSSTPIRFAEEISEFLASGCIAIATASLLAMRTSRRGERVGVPSPPSEKEAAPQ